MPSGEGGAEKEERLLWNFLRKQDKTQAEAAVKEAGGAVWGGFREGPSLLGNG